MKPKMPSHSETLKSLSLLHNNKGSALLASMIAALTVGVVSAIILQQSQVTEKQSRAPRIKSAMMSVEMQLRDALNQGGGVRDCVSGAPNCKELDNDKLDLLAQEIPGAQCPTPPCYVRVTDRVFDQTSGRMTAKISYDGNEIAIAPVSVEITLDKNEAWMNTTSNCNPALGDAGPLLVGFDSNGNKRCQSLPSACPAGSYIRQIDPMSLTTNAGVTCEPFPASVACPAGQYLISFQWSGGGTFVRNCQPLISPFSPSALNDPTSYAYAPATPPVVTSWPVSTTTTTTTTTTTSTTTTTIPLACASPSNPYSNVQYNACTNGTGTTIGGASAQTNPATGTYCTGWLPLLNPHGGNYSGNNSVTIRFVWQGNTYSCSYSGYISGSSSSGGVMGSSSGLPAGISCNTVNFFPTNQGWGGGLNILGPGPGYVACP